SCGVQNNASDEVIARERHAVALRTRFKMEPVLRGRGSLLGECELLRPRIADEVLLRKGGERMFRGVVRAASLAAVIALLSAGAALADAGGQGTVTITEHAHNVTLFSDPVTNPCTGEPGTLT